MKRIMKLNNNGPYIKLFLNETDIVFVKSAITHDPQTINKAHKTPIRIALKLKSLIAIKSFSLAKNILAKSKMIARFINSRMGKLIPLVFAKNAIILLVSPAI